MTRTAALEVATAKFNALLAARTANLFHGAAEPQDADYGYRHGWVAVGGFNFGTDEMIGPNNQPYLD